MKSLTIQLVFCAAMAFFAATWACAQTKPAPTPAGDSYAIIVVGLPGAPVNTLHYRDWLGRFYQYFTGPAGIKPANIIVLAGSSEAGNTHPQAEATSQSIIAAITQIGQKTTKQDQFTLVILGHAAPEGALVVTGPDLAPKDLGDALAKVNAENQVVLNLTSGSGATIKPMSRSERVLIVSNNGTEVGDSDFAEFFLLQAEAHPRAALLNLFNQATFQHAQWISHLRQAEEGGWVAESQESAAIFKKLYPESPDITRKLANAGATPEKAIDLTTIGKDEAFWSGRRLVSEHAAIEDTGVTEGIAPVSGEGFAAVSPAKKGDVGMLARRVVIGQSSLLPAPTR